MSTYLDLPLTSLRESPTNPRKHFDPAKLAELTKSVEAQGIFTMCRCQVDPFLSCCGEWEGNISLCICADLGLEGTAPS